MSITVLAGGIAMPITIIPVIAASVSMLNIAGSIANRKDWNTDTHTMIWQTILSAEEV